MKIYEELWERSLIAQVTNEEEIRKLINSTMLIGCLITKDPSRVGRNFIKAGSYIEIFSRNIM